jgi:hypothetical protein
MDDPLKSNQLTLLCTDRQRENYRSHAGDETASPHSVSEIKSRYNQKITTISQISIGDSVHNFSKSKFSGPLHGLLELWVGS